jgi:hypothetical protein
MSPALRQRLHPLLAEALDDGWQAFVRSQYSEPASRDGERFAAWLAESSRRTRQLVNERGFARLGGPPAWRRCPVRRAARQWRPCHPQPCHRLDSGSGSHCAALALHPAPRPLTMDAAAPHSLASAIELGRLRPDHACHTSHHSHHAALAARRPAGIGLTA